MSRQSDENPQTEIELPRYDTTDEVEVRSLPPADRGRQAYLVLAGCTLIQAPVWGYSLAFGVFQEYYTTHNNVKGSPGAIATVGTTLNGLMYLMMPLSFTALTRYPFLRPYCGPVGLLITASSLIGSAYATKVWHLLASQGVLCAIGSGLLFSPTTLYLDEWFIARKGLAYGTIWAGKSVGGVVIPFIMSSLLTRFGPRVTLLAWSVTLVIITTPLLFFLKPRIPISNSVQRRPLAWAFLKIPMFWMLQAGNIIQSLGYLFPTTYIASYAHLLGLTPLTGAILIAGFSLGSVPGALFHGLLGDRLKPTNVILISSIGSTISVLLLWGLAREIVVLVFFVLIYGFFAGGFSSTYPGILHEMKRADETVDTGLIMGLLLGGRGVGFTIGGPISASLLKARWSATGPWAYDTQYGAIIVCTAATAFLGGWGWMWRMLKIVLA
ncbi:hypothetical protein B7463_g7507, partial [Scytalidium lignicola]